MMIEVKLSYAGLTRVSIFSTRWIAGIGKRKRRRPLDGYARQ